MYQCDNCGVVFAVPEARCERHGFKYPPYEALDCCPACGVAGMFDVEREDDQDEFDGICERSA